MANDYYNTVFLRIHTTPDTLNVLQMVEDDEKAQLLAGINADTPLSEGAFLAQFGLPETNERAWVYSMYEVGSGFGPADEISTYGSFEPVDLYPEWGKKKDLSKGKFQSVREMIQEHKTDFSGLRQKFGTELFPDEDWYEDENLVTIQFMYLKSKWGPPVEALRQVSAIRPNWDIDLVFKSFDDNSEGTLGIKNGEKAASWLGLEVPLPICG